MAQWKMSAGAKKMYWKRQNVKSMMLIFPFRSIELIYYNEIFVENLVTVPLTSIPLIYCNQTPEIYCVPSLAHVHNLWLNSHTKPNQSSVVSWRQFLSSLSEFVVLFRIMDISEWYSDTWHSKNTSFRTTSLCLRFFWVNSSLVPLK